MKKKFYFLSILILFLINIGGVNALSTSISYGTSSGGSTPYYIGSSAGGGQYVAMMSSIDPNTPPFGMNKSLYMMFRFYFDDTDNKGELINSIVRYRFCSNITNNINSNLIISSPTNGYKYSWTLEGESCSTGYGSGKTIFLNIQSTFDGDSYFNSYFTLSSSTDLRWFLAYKDYDVFTKSEYLSILEQEKINSNLSDLNDKQEETNDKLDDLNDNITNSDSSEASGEAENFFSNFNTDTFGLTSVITAPLELIKSVTSKTCSPLHATLPFVSTEVNLPCLSTIYENHFGSFLTIYRTITFGFVSYWVCVKIFNLVKDFKNPDHDEIEVLDL